MYIPSGNKYLIRFIASQIDDDLFSNTTGTAIDYYIHTLYQLLNSIEQGFQRVSCRAAKYF
jgi:hypothetical protein